jgi:uncharacterized membrane-anchored protein
MRASAIRSRSNKYYPLKNRLSLKNREQLGWHTPVWAGDFVTRIGLALGSIAFGEKSMNKVAQVTIYFWIMKICATTLGETAGDLLSMTMNISYAVSSVILISLFLTTLLMQLVTKTFHPVIYWSVILTTSTAGTTMSDYMDRTLGLGYAKGSLILISCLLVILATWRYSEKTLSVDNIKTTKAEIFYWTAILFSNTLARLRGFAGVKGHK